MGLISKLFGGAGGKAPEGEAAPKPEVASAGPAPAAAAPASGQSRATCPRCDRALLPDMPCPFCTPQHFGEDATQESTLSSQYSPSKGLSSLGGVIVADKAALQHGAKGFLYVYEGPNKGTTVLLSGKFVSIGRDPKENVLGLKDGGVSTRHCEVRPVHHGYQIVDIGSKNGTFVNDNRVKEKVLANGDIIGFGATRIYVGVY